ncbi:hypothetical protein HDU76_009176, partial [Blyttiomyces sp. JEL0837]
MTQSTNDELKLSGLATGEAKLANVCGVLGSNGGDLGHPSANGSSLAATTTTLPGPVIESEKKEAIKVGSESEVATPSQISVDDNSETSVVDINKSQASIEPSPGGTESAAPTMMKTRIPSLLTMRSIAYPRGCKKAIIRRWYQETGRIDTEMLPGPVEPSLVELYDETTTTTTTTTTNKRKAEDSSDEAPSTKVAKTEGKQL